MRVDLFDFELPEERIALRPPNRATPRAADRRSRQRRFQDLIVKDLVDQLGPDDVMVFNDTKVIPAQLEGRRIRGENIAPVSATLHMRMGTVEAGKPSPGRASASSKETGSNSAMAATPA